MEQPATQPTPSLPPQQNSYDWLATLFIVLLYAAVLFKLIGMAWEYLKNRDRTAKARRRYQAAHY